MSSEKLSELQHAILRQLEQMNDLDSLHPAIMLHGSGQYAAARALARQGRVRVFPSGRCELLPPPALPAYDSIMRKMFG